MNDQRIDTLLSERMRLDAKGQPAPERLAELKKLLASNLRPVRPLPSDRKLVVLLLLFFVSFSVLAAWPTHYFGLHKLSATQMAIYFGVITACAFLCAMAIIQEIVPGSQRRISPMLAITLGVLGLIAVTVILFPNFDSSNFVLFGKGCFRVGSVCGLVAGLLLSVALRRGFFISPLKAAVTIGFFASLAGVAVLAMHCSLLTVPHILVWHFGVLLVGLAAGAGLGMLFEVGTVQRFSANRNFPNTIPE